MLKSGLNFWFRPDFFISTHAIVGIYEAKTRFSALIELVEQGEEVRITRHGKEVVRMLPVRRRPVITDEQIARELEQIQALQQTVRAPEATDSVVALRHTGRSQT